MLEYYKHDYSSGVFGSADLSAGKYVKMFSVNKSHSVNMIFSLSESSSGTILYYKRLAFISGATSNIYDFDIDSNGITVKLFDDGTNYVLYAKIPNTASVKLKIIQCDTPHLLKFYPGEYPVDLPGSGEITKRVSVTKSSVYYSIITLITYSGDWVKQFGTQVIVADGNEISGHMFVKGTQSGDGTQICTMPAPFYVSAESTFQTFCAMYQGTDNLWYCCTVRLGSDGSLKVYGLGTNAPAYVSIKVNLHYRCSQSTINQFLT